MKKVMSRKQELQYGLWVGLWIMLNLGFWWWWFQPHHIGNAALFSIMSAALFYETTVLPSFYLFFLGKMRRPVHKPAPRGLRVALITLCVPSSESIGVIEKQLQAMVSVDYPHDSWILDEGKDSHVKELAEKYGVKYFSRKGVEKYNQPGPPFKARTKAGNVNSWIEKHGDSYDYFVQFDIDHLPRPDYLDMTLGHLAADEKVAWVQAPSIYGNYENSWASRGSSEQELVLQGPLQMGFYGFSRTPFIIGSHCTYRMRAIREIGGFQPTRAEDHLDTVELAARGYKGVFVPEPIAVGDGPESFDTYLAQQFAWAYSMIQVLFLHTPRLIKNYTAKQAVQFLFAQTWYCLWSTTMLIMFLMPVLALVTNTPITKNISFIETLVWYLPLPMVAFGVFRWSNRWQQPDGLHLSWRGIILHVARWPVVTWAMINVIFRVQKPYMITPKGMKLGHKPFNLTAHYPYFILIALSLVSVLWFNLWVGQSDTQSYLLFALEGASFMAFVYFVAVVTDLREITTVLSVRKAFQMRSKPLWIMGVLLASIIVMTTISVPAIAQAVTWKPVSELPSDRIAIGAYDPDGILNEAQLDIEHSFVPWYREDLLWAALSSARAHGRTPLISLEPWPWNEQGDELGPDSLMADISAGSYDQYIRKDAELVKKVAPQQVIIRWSHEMELIGLYPWSTADALAYKVAYRRVVDIFREEGVENVLWMWSPAGNRSALRYYPGNGYVDVVGLTILSDGRWDADAGHKEQRSFEILLREKYWLGDTFDKPVWVAETGVSSESEGFQSSWLKDAQSSFSSYPRLEAFVYFNRLNQHAPTGDNYFPDWSLTLQEWKEVFVK